MTDWRDKLLSGFLWQETPIIVVLDPDRLLLEEQIFRKLTESGFDLITYTEPIAFRYAYEKGYREPPDNGQKPARLIVRFPHTHQESVPFDLLQQGECIRLSLAKIFPDLNYQMVSSLGMQYYDALFTAAKTIRNKRLGQKQTASFILEQIFSVRPDGIRTPAELLALLCRIHYQHRIIPDILIDHCLETWNDRQQTGIPEVRTLFEHDTFMAYLQDEWVRYLGGSDEVPTVPFDNDQIRLYVDTFFLEGALKPIALSPSSSARIPLWAHCGIIREEKGGQIPRLDRLLSLIQENLPVPEATIDDWKQCARLWAEAVVLYSDLPSPIPDSVQSGYLTLHQTIEMNFGTWILATFPTLPDRPYLPSPVMVHQIPHYLAHQADDRVALIVMDGMALDQWLIIREMLGDDFITTEDLVCAWVPTLTSLSRRSLFAGEKPSLVSGVNGNSQTEENLWRAFWQNQSGPVRTIGYSRGNNLISGAEVNELVHDATPEVAGFVINTIDNLMHRTLMGMPQMHNDVRHWMGKGNLQRFIAQLLDRGYQVYITADHGNVCGMGIGVPKQGDLVEETSVRARIYNNNSLLRRHTRRFRKIPWFGHQSIWALVRRSYLPGG